MKKICAALTAVLLLAGLLAGCGTDAPPPKELPDSVSQSIPAQGDASGSSTPGDDTPESGAPEDETPGNDTSTSGTPEDETPPQDAPALLPADGPRVADGCFTFTPQQLAELMNACLPDGYFAGGSGLDDQYVVAVLNESTGGVIGVVFLYENSDTPVSDPDSTAVNGLAFAFADEAVEDSSSLVSAVNALILSCDPTQEEDDAMTIFYSLLSSFEPDESPLVELGENGLRYLFGAMNSSLFALMIQPA